MKKRLFLSAFIIIFIGFSGFFVISVYATYINNLNFAKDTVMETARIYEKLISEITVDLDYLIKTSETTRITIISENGKVIADSRPLDLDSLENHLDRPEIQAALNNNPAAFIRYSKTLGLDLIYYAVKVIKDDKYIFLRTAIPVTKITGYLVKSLPLYIFIMTAAAFLCFFVMQKIINSVIKPFNSIKQKLSLLSKGNYVFETITGSYEEINEITREIDEIAFILQNNLDNLIKEKEKTDYILSNINDGIIVIDENKNIALINKSALDIFNVTPDINFKNLNYLFSEKILVQSVEDCVNTENTVIFEIPINGNIFLVTVKRLADTKLSMAVFSDVTQNRENAKRREEFFANASHELKTPLTSIKGFNELIAINNKDKNLFKYIESITRETERMLSLISDMLKLSELENTNNINPVSISLNETVNEVLEALSSEIEKKSISFKISGDAFVNAESGHIYELIKNLIENSVRYNDNNGKVSVLMENGKQNTKLIVSDDGIGIAPEEQTRIFERFYRTEKSRSQKSGGTGLGLSIVKHICTLYGWNLSLKSKLGVGTEVTVEFMNLGNV